MRSDFPSSQSRSPGATLSEPSPIVSLVAPKAPDRSEDLALLKHDPELRAVVPASDLAVAERALLARRVVVTNGSWSPPRDPRGPRLALLLDGTLIQEAHLADRVSAQLLGPGSVVHSLDGEDGGLPCVSRFISAQQSTLALLDQRFIVAARHWPGLWGVIHARLVDQLRLAAHWHAAMSLPRVDERILAVFWLIADRWGIVRPDGIIIRMPLTHEFIGRMVAARRPTVSLALVGLADRGLLTLAGRGEWRLAADSRRILEPRRAGEVQELRTA